MRIGSASPSNPRTRSLGRATSPSGRTYGLTTKTHILNLLHRLVDGKPIDPLPVNPPNALTLTTEPQANVGRYDDLRKAREARHAS